MAQPDLAPNPPHEERYLLGRLFVVPLIIVAVLVTCAVIVVIAFGAIASNKEMPISKVLATLEANPGEKTAGMMMPQSKEMWQAAQELALRLQNPDEVNAEEWPEIQDRLARLLERELAASPQLGDLGKQRLFFIMHASGRARAAQAVPILVAACKNEDSDIRREALGALALMDDVPEARAQLPAIAEKLRDADPVVRMVACAALSRLATPQDDLVIEALSRAQHIEEDQEVRWNAALTLARLGSAESLPTLVEMLTRDYWQRQRVRYQTAGGVAVDRAFTSNVIDEYLMATIDAARGLDDGTLWEYIARLTHDPAPRVAARGRQALAERAESGS